ncbi:MAG: hypothetical protein HN416_14040 [Nitrospina sp.]|jgi:hypothetical protein|nr:hypothetical protein [Nitrospina sp.]MBT6718422.1 hypothetical protein [Nitrospina sp.]
MKEVSEKQKKGLIIGSNRGVENRIIEHFVLHNYDIDHEKSLCSTSHSIADQSYDFIIFVDRIEDESSPGNLKSLSEIISAKQILVLFEKGGMKKFSKDELKNIQGYSSMNTNVSILQFIVEEIIAAAPPKVFQKEEKLLDLCLN